MNEQIKNFKTYDEQIQILKSRNLIVDDVDRAKIILSSASYYELINGYKGCFDTNEDYQNKYSLEFLNAFYVFDHGFQNILFLQSVFIETSFKTCLSYVISENFGIHQDDYLDIKNFRKIKNKNDKEELKKLIHKIKYTYKKHFLNPRRKVDQPTLHYLLNKDHIPAWILFKNITFNNAIDLYSYLKSTQKLEVIKLVCPDLYSVTNVNNKSEKNLLLSCFINSLQLVRKFRNTIAHNLQFIKYKSGNYKLDFHLLKKTKLKIFIDDYHGENNNIYSMIVSILLLINDKTLHRDFLLNIYTYLKVNDDDKFDHLYKNEYIRITNIPESIFENITAYLK